MIDIRKVESGKQSERDFLALPKKLYKKRFLTQDEDTERAVIAGTHALSEYFSCHAYVVYDDAIPSARFALSLYPDKTLYIGFFECVEDRTVAKHIFKKIDEFAKEHTARKITGPVDASFWIKYRLKTNKFEKRPYMSEPYNKPYYERLFVENGFSVTEKYMSHIYASFLTKKRYSEFNRKSAEFNAKDYEIVSITRDNFERTAPQVYDMVMELYNDFPTFHEITQNQFISVFGKMKYIIDPTFAKVAYKHNAPAGFVLALPNYGNLFSQPMTVTAKLRFLLTKLRAGSYVMLYLGVLPEHHGLSRALIKPLLPALYLRLSPLIGALIHEGKSTAKFAEESIGDEYTYVLLEKTYD